MRLQVKRKRSRNYLDRVVFWDPDMDLHVIGGHKYVGGFNKLESKVTRKLNETNFRFYKVGRLTYAVGKWTTTNKHRLDDMDKYARRTY